MLHSSVDTTELKPPAPVQALLNPLLHSTKSLIQTFMSAGARKGKSEGSLVWVKESN